MNFVSKKLLGIAGLGVFLVGSAGIAKADSYSYAYLSTDLCGSGGCPLPSTGWYEKITLDQSATGVTVTADLAPNVGLIDTGAGPALEFELPESVTTAAFSGTTSGFALTDGSYSTGQTKHDFDLYFTCSGGSSPACGTGGSNPYYGEFQFTVAGVTISDFTAGADGYYFVSDIYDGAKGTTGKPTGVVASYAPITPITPVVPEPPTLLLLGTGLAALAGALKLSQSV